MLTYFSKKIISLAKKHAVKEYPLESCGLVIKDEYIPCENIAKEPINDFKIDTKLYIKNNKNIEAIIHSHNNYPHASKKDMIQQIATNVPWGIINVVKGLPVDVFFWGDSLPKQDLIGRPFINGVYDCFNLAQDYYLINKGILLPMIPHDENFYEKNENLFTDNFKEAGFIEIEKKDLQAGDAILSSIISKINNHCGIYIGNGLILHHLFNRLSRTEPLSRWDKYITCYLRYEGDNKC